MPSTRARAAVPWLGCALLATAACGTSGGGTPHRAAAADRPTAAPAGAEIATVRGTSVVIRREPGGATWRTLSSPNDYGAPRVLLVDADRGDWLKVYLPLRPNGSTGWVRASDVTLTRTTRRVEIDPRAFRFTVYDGDRVLRTGKVATGTGGTPTPAGRFFFTELVRPADPRGAYGAYAFGLSGYSPTLSSFGGGPGQIAVHGTNAPGRLGSRASHGCIRVGNPDITWMARNLTLGTPVDVLSS
ncbi:L,D-transpeptidase [Actinomadura atramentaria]|uniref:L,D-transpeptidase n=1 Tax=Actinomadura atramentaria TaxID=1990 RepID=UPI00036104A5|nr:L,D-transpeptidase [Actinomadura atramentaria]